MVDVWMPFPKEKTTSEAAAGVTFLHNYKVSCFSGTLCVSLLVLGLVLNPVSLIMTA